MSIISQLHMDMAHRCIRQTLALVREGRNEEALEAANLAIDSYEKAISTNKDAGRDVFAVLAMLVPHPSEQPNANKQSAA